jgi:hypothetical protein
MTRKKVKKRVTNIYSKPEKSTEVSYVSSVSTVKGEATGGNEALSSHSRVTSSDSVSVHGNEVAINECTDLQKVSDGNIRTANENWKEENYSLKQFDTSNKEKVFRRRCKSVSDCSSLKQSLPTVSSLSESCAESASNGKDASSTSSVNIVKQTSSAESARWGFMQFFEDQTFLSQTEEQLSVELESSTYLASKRKSVYNFLQVFDCGSCSLLCVDVFSSDTLAPGSFVVTRCFCLCRYFYVFIHFFTTSQYYRAMSTLVCTLSKPELSTKQMYVVSS